MTTNEESLNTGAEEVDDSEDFTLENLWQKSLVFKIVAIVCAASILAFVITLIVSIAKGSSNSSDMDVLQKAYDDCQRNSKDLKNQTEQLKIQLDEARKVNDNLTQEIKGWINTTAELKKKLDNTTTELNSTKTVLKYWQIGAGVGGGATLIMSGVSIYHSSVIKDYSNKYSICTTNLNTAQATIKSLNDLITSKNSEISSLKATITQKDSQITDLTSQLSDAKAQIVIKDNKIADLNTQVTTLTNDLKTCNDLSKVKDDTIAKLNTDLAACQADLKTVGDRSVGTFGDLAVDGMMLSKFGHTITRTECYDSSKTGNFDQALFKSKCTAGSTYIIFKTDKNQFGFFMKKDLPTDVNTEVVDPDAFVVLNQRLYFGNIKTGGDQVAFKYPDDNLMTIGKFEIVIRASATTTTTAVSSDGSNFDLKGEKYYGTSQFQITGLVAYTITAS